jgi:light-regulated signal transduction histidine kinase (bacteriophytochrome)
MKKILDYVEGLPDRSKVIGCLLLNLLLGVADYITRDFSLLMFYFLPISFASWFIGKRAGFFISMVCGVELFIIDLLVAPKNVTIVSIRSWNALMEVCYLLLAGYLLSKVRVEVEHTRQKSIELEDANRELEAFNYTVAHDLRKPLTVVNCCCQEIRELYGDKLDEQCKSFLQEAYDGTLRMNRLIEALLNFSRMGHVEPRRETVDLSATAYEVAADLKIAKPGRKVTFLIADGISADGDANLLRLVLENLFGNAWKYTGPRDEGIIEFGTTEVDGKPAYFVRDNGTGFAMTDADKLFIPFHRLAGAEEFRGHGIGLATVERIIRRHGGRIWAEGKPGKGATFYFTLSGVRTI